MWKIKRLRDRLIFNTGIPWKIVFILRRGPVRSKFTWRICPYTSRLLHRHWSNRIRMHQSQLSGIKGSTITKYKQTQQGVNRVHNSRDILYKPYIAVVDINLKMTCFCNPFVIKYRVSRFVIYTFTTTAIQRIHDDVMQRIRFSHYLPFVEESTDPHLKRPLMQIIEVLIVVSLKVCWTICLSVADLG